MSRGRCVASGRVARGAGRAQQRRGARCGSTTRPAATVGARPRRPPRVDRTDDGALRVSGVARAAELTRLLADAGHYLSRADPRRGRPGVRLPRADRGRRMTATLTAVPSSAPAPAASARAAARCCGPRRTACAPAASSRLLVLLGALGFAAALVLASTQFAQAAAPPSLAEAQAPSSTQVGRRQHRGCYRAVPRAPRRSPRARRRRSSAVRRRPRPDFGGVEQFLDKRPFVLGDDGLTGAHAVARSPPRPSPSSSGRRGSAPSGRAGRWSRCCSGSRAGCASCAAKLGVLVGGDRRDRRPRAGGRGRAPRGCWPRRAATTHGAAAASGRDLAALRRPRGAARRAGRRCSASRWPT